MIDHIAIVMDGNGRWADQRGLLKLAGHEAGMATLKKIIKHCSSIGVSHLTMYAFSTENWKRSEEEVSGLFSLITIYMLSELEELHENNVCVSVIGDYEALPSEAVDSLNTAISKTSVNTGLQLHLAINYGSRAEMLRATSLICEDVKNGRLQMEDIDMENFSSKLFTAGTPDPDLVIRTSGEQRLSNYLLWQCAYSEYYFTDTLWPDFDEDELDQAILEFKNRKRRFGGR